MHTEPLQKPEDPRQTPWNKGKLIGSKPPLRTKDVCSIRTKLQVEKRTRDLAMFNLAIDSKLRGCDVISPKVEDVAAHGMTVDRAMCRQRKTGHPVRSELSERDDSLAIVGKSRSEVPAQSGLTLPFCLGRSRAIGRHRSGVRFVEPGTLHLRPRPKETRT